MRPSGTRENKQQTNKWKCCWARLHAMLQYAEQLKAWLKLSTVIYIWILHTTLKI
jgi:hypothetical protein